MAIRYEKVEVPENEVGLHRLAQQYVQLWCLNYIYAGLLVEVNDEYVVLRKPQVVYETGKMTEKKFKFAESCGVDELFIRLSAVESYSLAPQLVQE